jgi:hypothetical protein
LPFQEHLRRKTKRLRIKLLQLPRKIEGFTASGDSHFLPKIQATAIPTRYSPNMGMEKIMRVGMSVVGVMTAATMKMIRIA